MAELMFKRGAQNNLPAIGVDGCFYLTTDTNRLYVGQGENKAPVLLNQTVQIVESVSALPPSPPAMDNDFYYCISENVLAIYRSGEGWTQINTNTDDTVEVTDIAFGDGSVNATNTEVEYVLTLEQQKYDLNGIVYEGEAHKIAPLTAKLVLKTEDIAKIIPEESAVGFDLSEVSHEFDGSTKTGVNVVPTGSGSDPSKNAVFVPGKNVDSIELDDSGKIEINTHNTTYEFSVEQNDNESPYIHIVSSDTDEKDIYFAAGDGVVVSSTAADEQNTVIYTHARYNDSVKEEVTNELKLNPEDTFNFISGIEMDNGHITKVNTDSITMPFDVHLVPGVTHTVDSWQATFADNTDSEWTIDFSIDANNLQKALKKYVDDGLAAANTAMTFKNTISHPDALDTLTNVEAGDVYFLSTNVTTDDYAYRMGDLFIAVSISGAPGKVDVEDLKWVHVPAGDELIIDTLFSGIARVEGKAGVVDTNNNGSASFHIVALEDIQGDIKTPEENETLTLQAGQDLYIVDNTDQSSTEKSRNAIATVGHRTIETENSTAGKAEDAFSITAITGVDVNNGHVTKVTTQTFDLAQYNMYGKDNHIILEDSTTFKHGDIHVQDDTKWIKATVTKGTDDNADVFKIEHIGPDTAATNIVVTNDSKLTQEGTLNIISGVHYDSTGHVTSVDTSSLTMPLDTTYDYYIASDSDGNRIAEDAEAVENPYLVLKDRYDTIKSAQMYSNSTNLIVNGDANKVMFNMVWGTF